MTKCAAAGDGWRCDRAAVRAGYCLAHRHQFYIHGEHRPLAPRGGPRPKRFARLGIEPVMTVREVAEALGVSRGTVVNDEARALRKLRAVWEQYA